MRRLHLGMCMVFSSLWSVIVLFGRKDPKVDGSSRKACPSVSGLYKNQLLHGNTSFKKSTETDKKWYRSSEEQYANCVTRENVDMRASVV